MTYQEALAYLEQASSFGIKPGLERITALMDVLGNPQEDYKIVHVTGTNGKGSVTSYISYALFTSGLRVGRFTSPHLQSYTERIQINDGNITEEALVRQFAFQTGNFFFHLDFFLCNTLSFFFTVNQVFK